MKNKTHFTVALLLCAFTLLNVIPTYALASETAGDYRTVHNEHLLKVDKLPEIVEQVFALNDIEAGEPAFIVDDLFDKNRINKRLTMDRLFSLAINLDTDLTALTNYGLTIEGGGSYSINHYKTPQWASVSEVFLYMSMPEYFESSKQELRKMGLSNQDFSIIENYIHHNNINIQKDNILLESLKPIEKQISQAKSPTMQAGMAFNYNSMIDKKIQLNWYNWIQELLIKFPRIKQQALINQGIKELGFTKIGATPTTELNMSYFAKRIKSGELREQTLRRIKRLKRMMQEQEK